MSGVDADARCPVCGSETVRLEGEVVTRCPNLDCPAQIKNNLLHLAGRGALDIQGLGEKLVDQLVERGLVKRLSDVFTLDRDTLLQLERMGEKSADNLLARLDKARSTSLTRVLLALGMPHVGEGVADLLASRFGDLEPLMAADQGTLEEIPGIGPTLRTNLLRHLGSAKRVRAASVAELAAVPKITPKLAQRIHGFFHPGPDPDRAPE